MKSLFVFQRGSCFCDRIHVKFTATEALACQKKPLLSVIVATSEVVVESSESTVCLPDPVFLYVSRVHNKSIRREKTLMSLFLDSELLPEAKPIGIWSVGNTSTTLAITL